MRLTALLPSLLPVISSTSSLNSLSSVIRLVTDISFITVSPGLTSISVRPGPTTKSPTSIFPKILSERYQFSVSVASTTSVASIVVEAAVEEATTTDPSDCAKTSPKRGIARSVTKHTSSRGLRTEVVITE